MGLTVFPTILFNSAAGSDSAASGAGPATAITMQVNGATTNSTTVVVDTLSGNLDTVAQDGSAVLFITGIGFVRVSTTNNGTGTIVMETALTIGDNVVMAIGGKRATIDATESRRLFAATATPTASGASGQWTITLEDSQSLTSAITCSATAGTGVILVKSDSTTQRSITQTGNAALLSFTVTNRFEFRYVTFLHSNATKSYAFTCSGSVSITARNCVCGANSGTNCPSGLITRTGGNPRINAIDTAVINCGSNAFENGLFYLCQIVGCDISRNGGVGFNGMGDGSVVSDSIIAYNTGNGITFAAGTNVNVLIKNNVIDGNTSNGCQITGNNAHGGVIIIGNQFTNNGTSGTVYGLNFSGTVPHVAVIDGNNFYGNRSGAANGISLNATNLTVDPSYTDRTNTVRNYGVGTAMKSAGFPASTATIGDGQSGTTTYVDIGASQRQESSGGYSRGRVA